MVLRLRSDPPDHWRGAKCRGICASVSYDPFFDEDMDEAQAFCNGEADGIVCPIRDECLSFALVNNLRDGVWGGCSELTRKAIRRRWPVQGNKPRPEWHYMSQEDAMMGMRLADLLREDDDDDDEF